MTPVLIVSHGQPSAPGPAEDRLARFGAKVARLTRGRRIESATLATPGGLDRAVARFGDRPFLVYPLFMSDGWFVTSQLPKRLAEAGGQARILPPLGLDPGLPDLVRRAALDGIATAGLFAGDTTVLLTAHGSPRDPRPASAARRQAAALQGAVRDIRFGFVDEAPSIADAARVDGPTITLPLFAATNGHVRIDVTEALDKAGFDGARLPPIGEHDDVPSLIANAIAAADPANGLDS